MKQLVILSGKGGTGKTTVSAAMAHLAYAGPHPLRAVLADADVDAANLELVVGARVLQTEDFFGGAVARIASELCSGCGVCYDVCRFDAVIPHNNQRTRYDSLFQQGTSDSETSEEYQRETHLFAIDPIACEGCAACVHQCPTQAIHMESNLAGRWFRSESRYGPLFHAALRPAQENSGKLVALIRQQARQHALEGGYSIVLVDGPPGIGCPVISSISGCDLALIVAEPTVSGVHDMERALQLAAHFRVPAVVCINKADIYPAGVEKIDAYCREHDIEMIGRIPYDEMVTTAMTQGVPITERFPDSAASQALSAIWEEIPARLLAPNRDSS